MFGRAAAYLLFIHAHHAHADVNAACNFDGKYDAMVWWSSRNWPVSYPHTYTAYEYVTKLCGRDRNRSACCKTEHTDRVKHRTGQSITMKRGFLFLLFYIDNRQLHKIQQTVVPLRPHTHQAPYTVYVCLSEHAASLPVHLFYVCICISNSMLPIVSDLKLTHSMIYAIFVYFLVFLFVVVRVSNMFAWSQNQKKKKMAMNILCASEWNSRVSDCGNWVFLTTFYLFLFTSYYVMSWHASFCSTLALFLLLSFSLSASIFVYLSPSIILCISSTHIHTYAQQ